MFFYNLDDPLIRETINNIRNMKKHILAIPADAPATPPKPNTPAMIAIIINVIVQRNIFFCF